MIIDDFFLLVYTYGYIFLVVLGIIKFIILIWYKPNRLHYAWRNYFTYYGRYAMRDERMERWLKFKGLHNFVTILFFINLVLWLISVFIFQIAISHK